MGRKSDQPITGASTFDIEPGEEQILIAKANSGDGAAALRLYYYYDFTKSDHEQALKWLEIAAETGNLKAQYNLAMLCLSKYDNESISRGKYWLRKAAKSGYQHAIEYLKSYPELEQKP